MKYKGKYKIFDASAIKTYPISTRSNKIKLSDLLDPDNICDSKFNVPENIEETINNVAEAIIKNRKEEKPVVLFTGAHLVKNGLSRIIIELVRQNMITLVAGNGATAIHDFEIALIGETSENVPDALGKGEFGMAYEFCYHNVAITLGDKYKLGYGESLGKIICDKSFREEVLGLTAANNSPTEFIHYDLSILSACYKNDIPFTVHVGIGTDVIDQHPSFHANAKGGCSGRDFLIFANEISKFTKGGVVLNIGSAVTGPEILLKTVSMAANIGKAPKDIITVDFDIRPFDSKQMTDESASNYYFRDQKSIVTRIPQAFKGKGYYIQGNQKQTVPLLYKNIMKKLKCIGESI